MVGERELVALFYRADWARLCLSGEMRGLDECLISAMSHMMPNGPGPSEEPAGMRPICHLLRSRIPPAAAVLGMIAKTFSHFAHILTIFAGIMPGMSMRNVCKHDG